MGIHDGHREKMRRRFLGGGLEHFADHEALELLLFYAIPRRDTNPIAHALMDRYGSLSAVMSAPVEDLQKVEGIGESAAILLKMVPHLYSKARLADAKRQDVILNSTDRAGRYLMEYFAGESHEVIYQLGMDRKCKVLFCKKLGDGNVGSAALDLRKLVENVILNNVSSVVLAHNHPSGVALPSEEDRQVTAQIRQALQTVSIDLVDHIVVADEDFVSMAASGMIL